MVVGVECERKKCFLYCSTLAWLVWKSRPNCSLKIFVATLFSPKFFLPFPIFKPPSFLLFSSLLISLLNFIYLIFLFSFFFLPSLPWFTQVICHDQPSRNLFISGETSPTIILQVFLYFSFSSLLIFIAILFSFLIHVITLNENFYSSYLLCNLTKII